MADDTPPEQQSQVDGSAEQKPADPVVSPLAQLIPQDVLDQIPEPQQRLLMSSLTVGPFPIQNPLMAQMRPEHITTALSNQGRIAELQSKDNHENRLLVGFVITAAIVVVLVLALLGHSAELTLVFQYGFPFLGGIGVGFGASEYRRRG